MCDLVTQAQYYRAEALRLRAAAERATTYAIQSALLTAAATYDVMATTIEADARVREAMKRDQEAARASAS